jgi:hypothetical protein
VEKALGTNENVQDLTDEEGRTLFDTPLASTSASAATSS